MKFRGFLISYQINRLSFALVLFLLLSLPLFATDWYVDKTVSSSGNGQSWATAWKNFSNINWGSVQPGDIINISGGTDSTVYYETLDISDAGTTNNYITIRGAIDAGHNGKVIIDGQNTRSNCIVIEQGCGSLVRDWIYVKNLYLRRAADEAFYIHCNVNNLVIDGLDIRENGLEGIKIIGNDDYYLTENGICAEDIEIKNCTIISKSNNPYHEDNCVYAQMVAGLKIHNNFIHQQNKQIGVPAGSHEHVDPLQTHVIRDVKIYNNVMVIDSSVLGHGMILGIQSRPGQLDTVIIYNNYIYAGGHLNAGGDPYINGFVLRWYGYVNSVYPLTYVINNTVVTSNGGENTILQEYAGIFYNNIICQLGTNGQNPANFGGTPLEAFASSWGLAQTHVDSCASNLMWNEWTNDMSFGGNRWVGSGGSPTGTIDGGWAEWTNSSWGGTGINANPQFVNNVRERNGYVIASNSPARNAGEDLQSFIESKGLPWTDIEGNPRDSSPDIGAYEYDNQIPVELTSFTATSQNGKMILNWATATETNNQGFEIERKQDNSGWEQIGFREGNGTTTEPKEYIYIDDISTVQSTSLAYRLKQIDFDGSFRIRMLEVEVMPTQFELSQNYPNPFNPTTTISYSIPSSAFVTIKIFDILGNEIRSLVNEEKSAGNYELEFNAANLPSGIYFYRLQTANFIEARKMVLMK